MFTLKMAIKESELGTVTRSTEREQRYHGVTLSSLSHNFTCSHVIGRLQNEHVRSYICHRLESEGMAFLLAVC